MAEHSEHLFDGASMNSYSDVDQKDVEQLKKIIQKFQKDFLDIRRISKLKIDQYKLENNQLRQDIIQKDKQITAAALAFQQRIASESLSTEDNSIAAKSSPSSELKIDFLESEVKKERETKRKLINNLKQEFEERQFEMQGQIQALREDNESLLKQVEQLTHSVDDV